MLKLADRNLSLLAVLARVAQWGSVGVCVIGLCLLAAVHCLRCGGASTAIKDAGVADESTRGCGGGGPIRILRALLLALLALAGAAAFGLVLWVRARAPRHVAEAAGLTWATRQRVLSACATVLDSSSPLLPRGPDGQRVSSAKAFDAVITRGPDVSAFWAIGAAALSLAAILGLLHLARDAILDRFVERAAENAVAAAKTAATLDMGLEHADPTACVRCTLPVDRDDSTELPCLHRIHDACIFKAGADGKTAGFSCSICQPLR